MQVKKVFDFLTKNNLRKETLRIYFFQFGVVGINFLFTIFIARALGPETKGIYDLFVLFSSLIIEFGLLGIGTGLMQKISKADINVAQANNLAVKFLIFITCLHVLLFMFLHNQYSKVLPNLSLKYTIVGVLMTPFFLYKRIFNNLKTAEGQAFQSFKIELYATVFVLIVVLLFVFFSPFELLDIFIFGLCAIYISIAVFGLIQLKGINLKFDFPILKSALIFGFPLYIGAFLNSMHFKVDQLFINQWLGIEDLGYYAISVKLAELLFIFDSALISSSLSQISSRGINESYKLTKRTFKYQSLLGLTICILLLLLAYPLIKLAYGEEFIPAVLPLLYLIPGIFFWSISKVWAIFLNFNLHKTYITLIASISGLAINIGLNYYFIITLKKGIAGAAIASSISYFSVLLIIWMFSQYYYSKLKPLDK